MSFYFSVCFLFGKVHYFAILNSAFVGGEELVIHQILKNRIYLYEWKIGGNISEIRLSNVCPFHFFFSGGNEVLN